MKRNKLLKIELNSVMPEPGRPIFEKSVNEPYSNWSDSLLLAPPASLELAIA